ncbi:MAG: transcriptional regulator [Betaproteobacteria bacterium]|nr:transcriptional regulator [Betaproteobacteria bacterium]
MLAETTSRPCIYLVEDEADLREELVLSLGGMGFDVEGFGDATEFYRALVARRCDIAVIDVGLPGEDGFSVARHLHTAGGIGVVMLTARRAIDDRLRGLHDGADAYLVKPVDVRELAATLRAVGRRLGNNSVPLKPASGWELVEGGWVLRDPERRELSLTTAERAFLNCLFENRGQAVKRDQLIGALGGNTFDFDPHRLDSLASRLRRKAAEVGINLPLRSVRNTGYVFSATDSEAAAAAN